MYEIIVIAENKERLAMKLVREVETMLDDFSDKVLEEIRKELVEAIYLIEEIMDDRIK